MSFAFAPLFLSLLLSPSSPAAFRLVLDPSWGSSLSKDAIIGGERVTPDSRVFKMTVSITMTVRREDGSRGVSTCTGTLIKRDLVLSAAHCVTSLENKYTVLLVTVTLGSGRAVTASGWKFHPSYRRIQDLNDGGGQIRPVNDIALIKLPESAGSDSLVAQLPASAMLVSETEEMVVAGFGQRKRDDLGSSGILYYGWTTGEMKSVMNNVDFQIHMTGVLPCRGDSGGPVFRASDDHPLMVLGVTSHVKGNCEEEARAISVAHHLPWLRRAATELKSPL